MDKISQRCKCIPRYLFGYTQVYTYIRSYSLIFLPRCTWWPVQITHEQRSTPNIPIPWNYFLQDNITRIVHMHSITHILILIFFRRAWCPSESLHFPAGQMINLETLLFDTSSQISAVNIQQQRYISTKIVPAWKQLRTIHHNVVICFPSLLHIEFNLFTGSL